MFILNLTTFALLKVKISLSAETESETEIRLSAKPKVPKVPRHLKQGSTFGQKN